MNREELLTNDMKQCKLGVIGFCYDDNSSFMRGAAEAPPRIREAFLSDSSNLCSETGVNLGRPNLFFDAGDVFPEPGKDMIAAIEESIAALLTHNLRPLTL